MSISSGIEDDPAYFDPGQIFSPECRAVCDFAARCAGRVSLAQQGLLEAREAENAVPAAKTWERRAANNVTDAASMHLARATMKAQFAAEECEGPFADKSCGSYMYTSEVYNARARRPASWRRLRPVVALCLTAALGIGAGIGRQRLHAAPGEDSGATGTPYATDGSDCLKDLVTGLEPDSCIVLPPLTMPLTHEIELPADASEATDVCDTAVEDLTPPVLAGYLHSRTDTDRLSRLPEAYQKALLEVTGRPAEAYLLSKTGAILIWYTDDQENALTINYLKSNSRDRLDLCMGDNPNYDNPYKTVGELQATIFHEGTHAMAGAWQDIAKTPEGAHTKALLDQLAAAWTADRDDMLEQTRIQAGPRIIMQLEKFKAQFDAKGRAELSSAVQWLINCYRQEGGLQAVGFTEDSTGGVTVTGLREQFKIATLQLDQNYLDTRLKADLKDADYTAFYENGTGNLLRTRYEEAFSHYDEGSVMQKLKFTHAHGYEDVDELIASLLSSTQINPAEVVRRVNALPSERRERAIEEAEILLELIQENDPALLPHIYLGQVVNALRQPSADKLRPIASPRKIDEFIATGRRGWVSAPLAALAAAAA